MNKRTSRRSNMDKKEIGYRLFAMVYGICKIFPRKKNRVFLVMTHDAGPEGNVGVIRNYLNASETDWEFCPLRRKDTNFSGPDKVTQLVRFFIRKPYELATSSYVFQDNVFLPMAFIKFPKNVKVVQLWHGTGTIKKFGQDANEGRLKQLEKMANSTITHLIVNGEKWKSLYSHIFSVKEEKTFVTGMPRTDILFQEEEQEKKVERFYEKYPELIGKKLVLYAPTFRDNELGEQKLHLELEQMLKRLPKEVVIGLRLHPFVADQFQYRGEGGERVKDFSHYDQLNTLLFASKALITDYSSIIFEYVALGKPMYFYAYDLEKFSDEGRGFYEDYSSYVPGQVSKTTDELIAQMIEEQTCEEVKEQWEEKRRKFQEENYAFEDGNSTWRLMKLLKME